MKIIVKSAGKKGRGVFANQNFEKDDVILTADYSKRKDRVSRKDISRLSQEDQNHLDYVGRGRYVVDYSPISMINHSCAPNAYVKYSSIKRKVILASKDIKKGEEITYDCTIDAADNWKMNCHCGSKNCRKTIYGDYRKLPKSLQRKYWRYVPRWRKLRLRR